MRKQNILKTMIVGSLLSAPSFAQTIPLDTEGFHIFNLAADARAIYVSSSIGNNAYTGFCQTVSGTCGPKATMAAGYALLRNGVPDQLLLKRGDTFTEPGLSIDKSGRSISEPQLIGAYGPTSSPRPIVRTIGTGFTRSNRVNTQYVAITSLEIMPSDGSGNGISINGADNRTWIRNLLLEDLYVHHYVFNVAFDNGNLGVAGDLRDITIRRSVIADAVGGDHSSGLFMAGIGGQFVVDQCVSDHNGYNDDVGGSNVPNHFNHNFYIYNYESADWRTQLTTFTGNIISRPSHTGAQLRGGGIAQDNLFIANPIALQLGTQGIQGGGVDPTHVMFADAQNNVFTEGIDGPDAAASAIRTDWINDDGSTTGRHSVISKNLIHNAHSAGNPFAIDLEASRAQPTPTQAINIHDNVSYNGGRIEFEGDASKLFNITFANNIVKNANSWLGVFHYQSAIPGQILSTGNIFDLANTSGFSFNAGNRTLSQWKSAVGDTTSVAQSVSFPFPNRTIATYNASLGGAPSLVDFINRAKQQRKGNWDPRYTAAAANEYMRAGFGMSSVTQPPLCAADLNHDSAVTVEDLINFLATFEQGVVTADLDNGNGQGIQDGGVDINDLLYFIQHFSVGC